MRLEFEPSVTTLPLVDNAANDDFSSSHAFDLESLLKRGVAAAQSGERDNARKLLSQASAIDPNCEDAWMWLASISEYPEELLAFLDRVLSINSENERALEWRVATRSLLAKTFVQRAEAAFSDGSLDLASKCVDQALAHDDKTDGAWYVRARMAGSEEHQLEYFEKVLALNPDHEDARKAVEAIFDARSQAAFDEAKQAAIAGDHQKSVEILDAFLEDAPDTVDAWILRSHLSQGLDEKVTALEKALVIDPENAAARSGLAFLALTFGTSKAEPSVENDEVAATESPSASTLEMAPAYLDETAGGSCEESPDAAVETSEDVVDDEPARKSTTEYQDMEVVGGDHPQTTETSSFEKHEESAPAHSLEELFGTPRELNAGDTETIENLAPSFDAAFNESVVFEEESLHTTDEPQAAPVSPFDAKADETRTGVECPFCEGDNDQLAFECSSCSATLTLSDLEGLFSNHRADRGAVEKAVARMDAEREVRELTEAEFTTLGIGHLNLGNSETGLKYLQNASRLDPNNVILSGQINAIAIRLEEMRRQDELHPTKPVGKTILVVDDSPTVRKLISGKLEKSGHVVVCASDGVEALEQLENELPDLVLLDITMPRMDGYEVCKQIRSNPSARNLPVVMISGKDGFFDKVRGRMAGSTGYVTKPFGPETLMKALETYLLPEA